MTVDAIKDTLQRLDIQHDNHADGEENQVSTNLQVDKTPKALIDGNTLQTSSGTSVPSARPSQPTTLPIILCDAWYGFPKQKRPRKERINAVSRQLSNFLQWRAASESNSPDAKRNKKCHVSLLGNEGDVEAVQARVNELENSKTLETVTFQSNRSIHEYLEQQKSNDATILDEVVYLSPDASHTLTTTSPPPRIVVIGMLIDRRITTDRSRVRAEEDLHLKAAKLPLDELNVKELTSHEPLNVDTVMELMQRWWWNCDMVKQQEHENSAVDSKAQKILYKKCFLEAAAWAMKTQRERHPNRTVHLSK
eukprot:CAMPEP_0183741906 /NCGR_PEP_ID=MMETSP0737-20130205/63417_1 /TAXON_ID=385413 /ORGANISM="Thalassiosira miniscula, Strain CCMP1093" /LENGTH=307 /DNA_ID=CAMNT_0025977393 /DNA_START=83 /DNA_END=1006 /DNA_ORIENTATION=-